MTTETEQFWAGQFGNEYLQRNRVNWADRVPFWESALEYTGALSVLEVGCNAGWNLHAIQSVRPTVEVHGVDINQSAVNEARANGLEVQCAPALGILGLHDPGSIDLVFTAGVLIHVAPQDIESVMRAIVEISGRYVIAVEYMADQEEEIDYRGHAGKLWRRPFGKLYQDLGLRLLSEGVAGGFDQCGYVLLEKVYE